MKANRKTLVLKNGLSYQPLTVRNIREISGLALSYLSCIAIKPMMNDVFTVILFCCKLTIYQVLHICARNIDWHYEHVWVEGRKFIKCTLDGQVGREWTGLCGSEQEPLLVCLKTVVGWERVDRIIWFRIGTIAGLFEDSDRLAESGLDFLVQNRNHCWAV